MSTATTTMGASWTPWIQRWTMATPGSVAYYGHKDCKVQNYLSAREGDANAMTAPAMK